LNLIACPLASVGKRFHPQFEHYLKGVGHGAKL